MRSNPCDWDQESYCVAEGCTFPAAHHQLDSLADDGTPIYEMVCCLHARIAELVP